MLLLYNRDLLVNCQVLLVVISSIMVWLSTSHRTEKQELHFVHQIINWFLAGCFTFFFFAS